MSKDGRGPLADRTGRMIRNRLSLIRRRFACFFGKLCRRLLSAVFFSHGLIRPAFFSLGFIRPGLPNRGWPAYIHGPR